MRCPIAEFAHEDLGVQQVRAATQCARAPTPRA